MLIDVVTFFNELDLLEDRLNYLNPYVDKFVIIESNRTHSDQEKELFFELNKSRYEQFLEKIIYLPKIYDNAGAYDNAWGFEFAQRNHISQILNEFSDEDFFIVSDLDEIPNAARLNAVINILSKNKKAVARLIQKMYYYNLTVRQENLWNRAYVTNKANIQKYTSTWLRLNDAGQEDLNFYTIFDGGWHLSYFMSVDKIINKMQNFAHQEYNTDFYKDRERILFCIQNGIDPYQRAECPCTVIDAEKEFPRSFFNCFHRWRETSAA